MKPDDWISIASVFASAALAIFTIWISRRDARQQAEDEKRRHAEEITRETNRYRESLEREDRLRSEQRLDKGHIEYTVECDFLGPVNETCLAEIRLCAHNKGQTIQRFSRIYIRVRGIPRADSPSRWPERWDRAFFPTKIAEQENVIPQGVTYFTEPGVRQVFTYVTTVPTDQRFILIHSEFDYMGEEGKSHDCERVFEVPDGKQKRVAE